MTKKQFDILTLFLKNVPLNRFRELHDCIVYNKTIRFEIPIIDIKRISNWITKLNLCFAVGNKSFKTVIDTGMDTWSSATISCSSNDISAMAFIYINADKNNCEAAKKFDEAGDDYNFGKLLKYPKCCIESYIHWHSNGNNSDPIAIVTDSFKLTSQLQSFQFPNPFTRYIGSCLYSHFPCSLNCEATKSIASDSLKALEINFPEIAEHIFNFEKSLVLFQLGLGVCLWTNFKIKGNAIFLDSESFSGQGHLKNLFETIDEIEWAGMELKTYSNSKSVKCISSDKLFFGIFN